jgi:hypothetical protein
MPALYVTEAQRYWLERLAEERRIEWLSAACKRPARRTLPATKWRGSERVK